jgi:hypothetical protein
MDLYVMRKRAFELKESRVRPNDGKGFEQIDLAKLIP